MMSTLIIRSDAGHKIGGGHVMRCLALAQEWKVRGGQTIFVSQCDTPFFRDRIMGEGHDLIRPTHEQSHLGDLATILDQIRHVTRAPGQTALPWVVLDGYHFGPECHDVVLEAGFRLLVIDDTAHLDRYHANVVLNPNPDAESLSYDCMPGTRFLRGPRYSLLRSEFLSWRNWERSFPSKAGKVLVTLGAADPGNVTLQVILALREIRTPTIQVKVVVGPYHSSRESLYEAIAGPDCPISVIETADSMPELMAWADVAISAGGVTVWEMSFMGLPCLLLELAANQRSTIAYFENQGVGDTGLQVGHAIIPGRLRQKLIDLLLDSDHRTVVSRSMRQIVDGYGTKRVVDALCEFDQQP